jgi:hypothetical protein
LLRWQLAGFGEASGPVFPGAAHGADAQAVGFGLGGFALRQRRDLAKRAGAQVQLGIVVGDQSKSIPR